MKRKKYIILLCFLILFTTGCGNNNVSDETQTQEYSAVLENPTVNIQSANDNLSSFYTNFVIKDNYRVYTLTEKTESNDVAIPDWQAENGMVIDTADFVNLMDDKMCNVTQKRIDFLNEKLRPSGMSTGRRGKKEIFMKYKTPCVKEYISSNSVFMDAGQERERTAYKEVWDYSLRDNNKVVDKYNVVCMSVNMYEEFYNCSNSTKIFIYGIPEETFNNNQEDNGSYQYPNGGAILKKYHNGECQLDTLAEIEVTKSGNYYMDFSEIIANDEYKDIIIEMELIGEMTDEYTYAWYGFAYKTDNEQAYQSWKAENMDKFIY